jgi:hypothetical protein
MLNSGYMAKQFLILLPKDLENNHSNRKAWTERVMNIAKTVGIWRFPPIFEYAGDESISKDDSMVDKLDMHLLNADIGGYLGRYIFDDVNDVLKDDYYKDQIFSDETNKANCAEMLTVFWNCWN